MSAAVDTGMTGMGTGVGATGIGVAAVAAAAIVAAAAAAVAAATSALASVNCFCKVEIASMSFLICDSASFNNRFNRSISARSLLL